MKHLFLSLLLLTLFVTGCTTQNITGYPLNKMPTYNSSRVDEEYKDIGEARAVYLLLSTKVTKLEESGAKMTSNQIENMYNAVDKYLYWSSAAIIQMFHENFTASHESLAKTWESLKDYAGVILDIERNSSL